MDKHMIADYFLRSSLNTIRVQLKYKEKIDDRNNDYENGYQFIEDKH